MIFLKLGCLFTLCPDFELFKHFRYQPSLAKWLLQPLLFCRLLLCLRVVIFFALRSHLLITLLVSVLSGGIDLPRKQIELIVMKRQAVE